MDILETLPVKKDAMNTPEELNVLSKYGFNTQQPPSASSGVEDDSAIRWKLVLWTTVLFIVLSNQYVDDFLSRFNYLSNSLVRLGVRIVIFAVAFFTVSYFITN